MANNNIKGLTPDAKEFLKEYEKKPMHEFLEHYEKFKKWKKQQELQNTLQHTYVKLKSKKPKYV